MNKWQYATSILKFKEKGFAISRKDVLQGLEDESANNLKGFGDEGWELVAVMPFSTGGTVGMFSPSSGKTDAVVAFLKRPVG